MTFELQFPKSRFSHIIHLKNYKQSTLDLRDTSVSTILQSLSLNFSLYIIVFPRRFVSKLFRKSILSRKLKHRKLYLNSNGISCTQKCSEVKYYTYFDLPKELKIKSFPSTAVSSKSRLMPPQKTTYFDFNGLKNVVRSNIMLILIYPKGKK